MKLLNLNLFRRFATGIKPKSTKKSISGLKTGDLRGQNVFVRVDFNVSLDKKTGEISDDSRIRASLPTIQFLQSNGARVILASHLGRPDGKVSEKARLTPVSKRLSTLLNKPVIQTKDSIGDEVKRQVSSLKDGDVLLLENVRFHKGEEENNRTYSQQLVESTNPYVYVNDAFGTAHRAHSSTAGVTEFIKGPKVAGFLLEKELQFLQGALDHPIRPFASVVGGSKVSTKITVLESLLEKSDKLLLGGAMIFTFFLSRGLNVGKSLVEKDKVDLAKKLEEKAAQKGAQLILPTDVVIAKEATESAERNVVKIDNIPDGWIGLDIGPESIQTFTKHLKETKTVLWNGPVGMFEVPAFASGTNAIAHTLAELTQRGVTTVVGGGDTATAIAKLKLDSRLSHVSTGGGASLELLEGRELPGVAALDNA